MRPEDKSRSSGDDAEATRPAARGGSIRGLVKHRDGTPVRGALVTIEGDASADIAQQTGDDGAFLLGNLAAGSYVVHALSRGVAGRASVAVNPDGEHHVEITADEGDAHGNE